jgi:uncharacterized membrane protein YeaQ/YmgE (transglycosylase-associated protein family)
LLITIPNKEDPMSSLVILAVIWVLLGLILGYYAARIFKGERPYGLNGDIAAGLIAAVLTGLADWYLIPAIFPGLGRFLIFLAAIVEPLIVSLLALWFIRYRNK